MNPHPTKICDTYIQTKTRCEECMDAETEIDFWHECYNGKHSKPEDCPTWYDWCNCGLTMAEEIEYLRGQRDGLALELKEMKEQKMWETDHAWNTKDKLKLLKEGWEPFAVTPDNNGGYIYHFRRFVKESK